MKNAWIALVFACIASSAAIHAQSPNLFDAARANDASGAQALLAKHADVNQHDDKGYTPLILATYNDNFEVAQLLLMHGASTEIKDNQGRTALMGAAFKGNEREVKLLLDYGANVTASDSKGMTSMMYAAMFGRISVIKVLRAGEAAKAATSQVSSTR